MSFVLDICKLHKFPTWIAQTCKKTNYRYRYLNSRGFTIIELVIVMIIIGLLAGAVMSGSAVIKGARIQGLATEIKNYKTGIITFRSFTGSWPGDVIATQRDFPTYYIDSGGGSVSEKLYCNRGLSADPSNDFICNGNGNDQVVNDNNGVSCQHQDGSSGTVTLANQISKSYLAWCHLYAQKSIDDGLVVIPASGATYALSKKPSPGLNIPKSKKVSGGYMIWYDNVMGNNFLYLAKPVGNAANYNNLYDDAQWGASTTPQVASALIGKMDDGTPNGGILRIVNATSFTAHGATCSTDNTLCSKCVKPKSSGSDVLIFNTQNNSTVCKLQITVMED
jgi:prepilin-type N-terminal cleavage/methylation domain-containing protein